MLVITDAKTAWGTDKAKVVTLDLTEVGYQGSFSASLEPEVLSFLTRIRDILAEQGIKAYVVGGFVRDALLEREMDDFDIALPGDTLDIARKVATGLGGKYVLLDEVNKVARVVLAGKESAQWTFDFSAFEGGIEQDLGRRDFTIDAMAVELEKLVDNFPNVNLIDPFGGWGDLRNGVIRMVTETVFTSDAVRLLRGVRLAAELGFRIDETTETMVKRDAHLVSGVAGERVREELLRLLACPRTGRSLAYLDKLGLLTNLFPELLAAKGVEQPKEHFWDVFTHLLKTVEAVEFLLRQGTWEYDGESALAAAPWSPELAEHFDAEVSHGSTRRSLLKLAGLLHDVSKPETKTIEAGGRIRFLGHGKGGATVATRILERLRFSSREIKLIETEITHHLRPGQMSQNEPPTRRAIYRYFRDTGDAGVDILYLSLADHLATRGPNLDLANWRQHGELVAYVLSRRFQEEIRPPRLIDGNDLINIFGLSPGPEIGKILEVVKEVQASGEITTREGALTLARRLLTSMEAREKDGAEEE